MSCRVVLQITVCLLLKVFQRVRGAKDDHTQEQRLRRYYYNTIFLLSTMSGGSALSDRVSKSFRTMPASSEDLSISYSIILSCSTPV